ncbi:MAG: radical SAM protein [Chloroflexi bacterium]|nr:radical SAM protein [Chloroflexota bacterium]
MANREGAGGLGAICSSPPGFTYPLQTIAYVAAALNTRGYSVGVVDAVGGNCKIEGTLRQIAKRQPDVIGVFLSFATLPDDISFVRALSQIKRQGKIVLFGASTPFISDRIQDAPVDVVLVGEAEAAFAPLCDAVLSGAFDSSGTNIASADALACSQYKAGQIQDVDSLPLPAWELVYRKPPWLLSLSASRGCPESCAYCPYVVAQGNRLRTRSTEAVCDELRYIAKRFRPSRIVFRDPVFAADRQKASQLCETILVEGLNISWECESRPEHFDVDLLKLMKRAGCEEVKIGIETADGDLLHSLRRVPSPSHAAEYLDHAALVMRTCRELGLSCRAFVMIGLPGDTALGLAETKTYLESASPAGLNVKRFESYPGIKTPQLSGRSIDFPEAKHLYLLREQIEEKASKAPRHRHRSRSKTILLRTMMRFADAHIVGTIFRTIAGRLAGQYKDRRMLAYLTSKPYVSPRATIKCASLCIGQNCFIDDSVTIFSANHDGEVRLGQGVHLYRGTNIEVGAGGSVIIGANTHVQGPCDFKGFGAAIIIGSEVQIAPYCTLSSYDHAFDDLTRPILAQGLVTKGDTVIEDDVWLGSGVKVLAGVRVGTGAVVGAGSVVTKDIPPYSVAAGVPARVIRTRGSRIDARA